MDCPLHIEHNDRKGNNEQIFVWCDKSRCSQVRWLLPLINRQDRSRCLVIWWGGSVVPIIDSRLLRTLIDCFSVGFCCWPIQLAWAASQTRVIIMMAPLAIEYTNILHKHTNATSATVWHTTERNKKQQHLVIESICVRLWSNHIAMPIINETTFRPIKQA